MSNHDDCDDTCQAKIIEQAVFSAPPDQPEDAALLKAMDDVLDTSGCPIMNRDRVRDEFLQLFHAHERQAVQAAVYGFHEFIIGKDIIRPETDQAFNYGRLHHALDAYIAEQPTQPPAVIRDATKNSAADTTKQSQWEPVDYDTSKYDLNPGQPPRFTTKQGEGESDED